MCRCGARQGGVGGPMNAAPGWEVRAPREGTDDRWGLLARAGAVLLIALISPSSALIRRRRRWLRLARGGRRLLGLPGQPDQRQRLLVDLAGRLQAGLALEPAQGGAGAWTKDAVDLAGVEAIVVERLLQLAHLVRVERDRGSALACAGLRRLRSRASLLRQRRERCRQRQGDGGRENE